MANVMVRSLKVYEQSGYGCKPAPMIILKGQWLRRAGFESGDRVSVCCEGGRIVIVPADDMVFSDELGAAFLAESDSNREELTVYES